MSVEVELFTAPDYHHGERHALAPLLRDALRPMLGEVVDRAGFRLSLQSVDDEGTLEGNPSMVNLRPGHGYAIVTAVADGRIVYRHPHTIHEIVGQPLQRYLARARPDVGHWGYGLVGPGLENLALVRPVPAVEGQVEITPGARRGITRVQALPEPEPEPIDLAELGVAGNGDEPVVLIGPETLDKFMKQEFASEVEEGGFVIGHRRRDPAGAGREVLEITDVVRARTTGASLLRFTFTGESFLEVANLLASRGRQEEILGWYHTHLFDATDGFGLSSIDVALHRSTFRRPWQVAALVNLGRAGRTLRFYHAPPAAEGLEESMTLMAYQVVDRRPGSDGAVG